MTKVAAGSLLRTVFSRAEAGAFRIAVKRRLNLQLPPVAQWETFWSVTFSKTRNVCFWWAVSRCPLMAHSGHGLVHYKWLLSRVKQQDFSDPSSRKRFSYFLAAAVNFLITGCCCRNDTRSYAPCALLD